MMIFDFFFFIDLHINKKLQFFDKITNKYALKKGNNFFFDLISSTASFESTTIFSESKIFATEENKNDIIHYKRTTAVITKVTYLLSFLIVVISLFGPWVRIRLASSNYVRVVLNAHIVAYSSEVVTAIQNLMKKYELVISFLSSVNTNPDLIRCSDQATHQLVKYVKTISANIYPPPFRYTSGQLYGEKRYCQFEFEQDDIEKFVLHYIYDFDIESDPYVHLRTFSYRTDFENWDPFTQGTFLGDYHKSVLNLSVVAMNRTTPTWFDNVVLIGNQSTLTIQQIMCASATIDKKSGTILAVSGISLRIEDIYVVIKSLICGVDNSRYVLLSSEDTALIESNLSVIQHLYVNFSKPVYPKLNKLNSTFWDHIDHIYRKYDSGQTFETYFEDVDYVVVHRPILSQNTTQTFTLIVCFPLNQRIRSVHEKNTYIFVAGIVILLITSFFALFLVKRNKEHRTRKLLKQTPILNRPYSAEMYIDDFGVVPKSIQNIRDMQLLYPDDQILNRVLDGTVENLSTNKNKKFSLASKHTLPNCQFCNHSIPKKVRVDDETLQIKEDESSYSIWKATVYPQIKLQKYVSTSSCAFFPIDTFYVDPLNTLKRYVFTAIVENKALIAPFDPDCLLIFFTKIEKGIKNPIHCAQILASVQNLLHGPFNYWIMNKIDVLALIFSAYLSQFSIRSIKIDEMGNEFNEEEEILIFNNIRALNDEESLTEENINYIYELFWKTIPAKKDNKTLKYFWKMLKILLRSFQNKKQFDLLGEARVRIQSPEFSVHTDIGDRALFMKCLLKLCDFCDYWTNVSIMTRTTEISNVLSFLQEEIEDRLFVASYHYEMASKIASQWISLFVSFKPLEEIVENNKKIIEYWNTVRNELLEKDSELIPN